MALNRLFANLIDNALKYGGGCHVTLGTDYVKIVDPGSGFTGADIDDALKPYGRLGRARSQNIPGSGLGLSIVNNICRRHGWQLSFQQSGDGFTVVVGFEPMD